MYYMIDCVFGAAVITVHVDREGHRRERSRRQHWCASINLARRLLRHKRPPPPPPPPPPIETFAWRVPQDPLR